MSNQPNTQSPAAKKKSFFQSLSFPLFGYILKRMVIFLPTLFFISLITFLLISSAPGDPAETMLNRNSGEGQASDRLASDAAYRQVRAKLGLDLPTFYFSFSNAATCDTLNRIAKRDHREVLDRMTFYYGNWDQISAYYTAINKLELSILGTAKDSLNTNALIALRNEAARLYLKSEPKDIKRIFGQIAETLAPVSIPAVNETLAQAKASLAEVESKATPWKRYIPSFHWHGTSNQYHRWLFGTASWIGEETDPLKTKGFIRMDFGISYFSKRPVISIIKDAIVWTFLISILSIIIQYIVSIPLGVFSAVNKDSRGDRISTVVLFILYSLPSFWIGTLAIFFLGGGDYLDVFPPYGLGDATWEDGFLYKFGDLAHHLILPLIVATYGSFAFLSRQMRGAMLGVLRQDFVRTARAKGLSDKTVVWKHAFRNSLLPIITIFAHVFPALIGGSIILEFLFTIPGLGQTTYMAVIQKDYPMILTTTMFAAILTLVGYLVADIMYAIVDPRISYSKK